jgi:hypothetical protein
MNYKKLIIIILLLVVSGLVIFFVFLKKSNCSQYKIGKKSYCLLVADTQEKREKGLMYYCKPVSFEGMVFIFPNYEKVTFWNYNTYLNLDVLWLKDDQLVGKSLLPSIEKSKETIIIESPNGINRVVELIR